MIYLYDADVFFQFSILIRSHPVDTGQSTWDTSPTNGETRFNVKLKANSPSVLTGLNDVSVGSEPSFGQLLTWNSTSNKWVASGTPTGGGGATDLDDLSDVTIASPALGQILFYDDRADEDAGWVNGTPISLALHNLYLESQLGIGIEAGQTSAPFLVSDSGGNHVWYIDASANLFTSGGIDVSGNKITQVGTPTATDDAATKLYVDESASGVSGNYILKDGSIDFTGAQAGIAFGASQGVSGATLSGTTIEGVTVYGTSVSGATVSATDLKAVTVTGIDHGGLGGLGDDDHTQYILVAGTRAFTGNQSMGSNKLTSVTNPTADQDAATKVYVDENTVDVSGNYILKDGSVDFTGAQAGIAFGATEGVSGAIVSGTTVEGLTVYAPSVSGATVSATTLVSVAGPDHGVLGGLADDDHTQYILVAGTRAFTGDQSMGSNKLTSVTNPTADQDAATKVYVDENTVDVSGEYILRDGSVDFTGAQAGVAFGAVQGVSGATVSGTTVEGQTVYAPSVSGATVSGTSVKAVLYSGAGILDEDSLASDSNTHLATQQSIKGYVDSRTAGAAANYILKGGSVAFTGDQSMGSNKLTSVTDPASAQDAATKAYVDSRTAGAAANYILKDGSVDFTGAQAGIAFGATEGVSGATVSGTTINGITVSGTSVSGATVSATDLKAVTVTGIDHGGLGGLAGDDHTQYVIKTPSTTDRNLIVQGSTTRPPFAIQQAESGNSDLTQWDNSDEAKKAWLDKDFKFNAQGVSGTDISGVTVYGTSVSGATVSGTAVKAVLYSGDGILDEDAMGTDSNTHLATQQSIKAYVDSRTAGAAANYILRGGSVAFTGDQSMGSNKLTSVTDPASAQDAATKAYVDSRTAGVAANYILKDGSVAFTAAQAGVSGTADASLTTNLLAFQRPFHHTAYRSGSFSNGQQIRLFLNTTDNDANFVIPAGETLKILAAYGRCKSGGTAGTTTWTLGIQTWETQAHSGARDWDLATGETTDTNSYINIVGRGTLASPLATIVGADDPVGMVFLEHANGGGGSSGNDKHTIDVYGVFVDS